MTTVLLVIAPLFLVIFASAVFERLTGVGERWSEVLNEFALNVGFPALVISALARAPFRLADHAPLLAANSLFLLAVFILAFMAGKLFRLGERGRRTLFLCLGFGNVAYLGIPILVKVSGDAVLPAASMIIAVYLFWIFTLGIGVLEFQRHAGNGSALGRTVSGLARNPLLLSVFAGLAITISGVTIPPLVTTALDMVAAAVTPIVLILIGLFLGRARLGRASEWIPVAAFSVATLGLLPAGFYGGLLAAGANPQAFSVSIIQSAMPLAITPFALARQYDLDEEFVARAIVMSTVCSAGSLPFWIALLE